MKSAPIGSYLRDQARRIASHAGKRKKKAKSPDSAYYWKIIETEFRDLARTL